MAPGSGHSRNGDHSDVESASHRSKQSRRKPRSRSPLSADDRDYDDRRKSSSRKDRERRQNDRYDSDEDRSDRKHRRHESDARGSDRRRERRRDRSRSDSPDRSYRRRSRSRSRSRDRGGRSHHSRRSRSPPSTRKRSSRSPVKSRAPLPSQDESFRGEPGDKPPEKQKPNFKPTGLLAKEANTVAGSNIVLKYHEPPEARKPSSKDQWRLYVFKKNDLVDTVHLYQRSVWLMGRDRKVTDLPLEHPSISKQHAVIQFRHTTSTNEFGDKFSMVKPYVIDLNSANGTKLNGKKMEPSRYMELLDQDVLQFGDSEREYVMQLPAEK